jgi:hypothetical protein
MFLLHADGGGAGIIPELITEIFGHGILDTLNLVPFLFVTYLLMEYIEHKAESHTADFIRKSGGLAPVVGGLAGSFPQCGFSAMAANLYSGRLISLGTLVAVFLSTSDEMIPILISGKISAPSIFAIVFYKTVVAILCGLLIDLILRRRTTEKAHEENMTCHEHCHCHDGIFRSALVHTLKTGLFILIVNLSVNGLIFFVGEEAIGGILYNSPFISHLVAAVFGLIPNCAASVVLTTLATDGLITGGTMMAGLFSGAGIGLAVLLRENRPRRANLAIIFIVVAIGCVFGFLADILFPNLLFL